MIDEFTTFSVYFSGVDCSGKNTLMHELAKSFDYSVFMSPRSPICCIVYDMLYRRYTFNKYEEYNRLIKNLLHAGAYFVLVTAYVGILKKRAIDKKEKHVFAENEFRRQLSKFDECFSVVKNSFKRYEDRFISVDNSGKIEDSVLEIKKKIGI